MKINTIQIYIYYASYFFYLTTKMGEREAEQKYTSTTYQYNNFLSDALLRNYEWKKVFFLSATFRSEYYTFLYSGYRIFIENER